MARSSLYFFNGLEHSFVWSECTIEWSGGTMCGELSVCRLQQKAKVCTLICAGAKIHNWRAPRRQLLKHIPAEWVSLRWCVAAGSAGARLLSLSRAAFRWRAHSRGASNSAAEREIRLYWISLIVFHASTNPAAKAAADAAPPASGSV
jgi:hypothetical protein